MEQGEVVVGLLLPADEQAAEAVHPGVRALDHPAPGPIARDLPFGGLLFAARADVGGVAPFRDRLPRRVLVVALVQAQVLRPAGGILAMAAAA